MNLQAVFPKTLFERARGSRDFWFSNGDKVRRGGSHALDLPEVSRFIGRDPDHAARRKRTRERRKKLFRDKTARGMAPLRPRIGKHQMKDCDGTGRQQLGNRIRKVATQDARVAQTTKCDLGARAANSSG